MQHIPFDGLLEDNKNAISSKHGLNEGQVSTVMGFKVDLPTARLLEQTHKHTDELQEFALRQNWLL